MKLSRISKLIILITVLFTIFGFNQNLFSWGLFDLFTDVTYSHEGLNNVVTFNPDTDILYLPELGDKELFNSIQDLSICRRQEVRKYIYIYLTRGREFVKTGIGNSYVYSDIVDEIFRENPDVPIELALLPLIESAFNPNAVSRSNAVGLWQFVSNTSNPLGLRRDRYVDERRDIGKSTRAAIRHLRNLYNTFGNWELALAAYNGGGGHVRRAMIQSGKNNLWDLIEAGALRQETSEYVPRYIALVLIYRNQRLFGVKDEIDKPEATKTALFRVTAPVDMTQVSRLSSVSMEVIRRYNPQLKQNFTPPWSREYTLRLPKEGVKRLNEKKKELYRHKVRRVTTYRVREGDCLSKIALRYKKKLPRSSDLIT